MGKFLESVERHAFRMARIALRGDDDALDVVQDAMMQLTRSYAQRPETDWAPLFYRILQNRIRDLQRRRKVRQKLFGWLAGSSHPDTPEEDPLAAVPATEPGITERLAADEAMVRLEQALQELPGRQQEAFMLRALEGLDVAETAQAMGCTAGSVKTHYSRAVHTLRERLGDVW
jgi:RNA polymerase sigma-70 factor (ECF subfamily)